MRDFGGSEQSLGVALAGKKRPEFARGIVGVVDLVVAFLGLGGGLCSSGSG